MMQAKFDLLDAIKERGKKFHGFIDLCYKVDGSTVRLPYMIVTGTEEGPVFLSDCCTHGDEYEGAEAISKVYNELDPAKLKGTFVGVPAVNLEAFNVGNRVSPLDWGYNDMNRAFPGNPEGMITNRIAYFYFENFIKKADYVISFHGGGNGLYMEPLSTFLPRGTNLHDVSYRMAKAFGVSVLWEHADLPFSGVETLAAQAVGVPCNIVELGGQGVRNDHREELVGVAARGLVGVMQEFGMLEGKPAYLDKTYDVRIKYVHTDEGGYHKLLVKPMDFVKEGQVCSEIINIFGEKVGEVKAPFDCYIVGYWCYSTIHPGHWAFLFGKPLD